MAYNNNLKPRIAVKSIPFLWFLDNKPTVLRQVWRLKPLSAPDTNRGLSVHWTNPFCPPSSPSCHADRSGGIPLQRTAALTDMAQVQRQGVGIPPHRRIAVICCKAVPWLKCIAGHLRQNATQYLRNALLDGLCFDCRAILHA